MTAVEASAVDVVAADKAVLEKAAAEETATEETAVAKVNLYLFVSKFRNSEISHLSSLKVFKDC